MTQIAIIGSGMAGLTLANMLTPHLTVSVFDKSRGPGGRMATRRADPFHFDHGAQFFTIKSAEFLHFLEPAINDGTIEPWPARFVEINNRQINHHRQWDSTHPHYVAVPGMNALGKRLAQAISVHYQSCITKLIRDNHGWTLVSEQQTWGPFDWVIVTCPAAQTKALLPASCQFREALFDPMLGCYSLMLGFSQALELSFDAALVRGEHISWIARNHSKPQRPKPATLLVHASNAWAQQHLEAPQTWVQDTLFSTVRDILPSLPDPEHIALHRWRYANCPKQSNHDYYIDPHAQLIACGDWCIRGRIEAAFTSAYRAGQQLLSHYGVHHDTATYCYHR